MRTIGSLFLILALALFLLARFDRQSSLALAVVELDTTLRYLPSYSLAGILGLLFWAPPLIGQFLRDNQPTGARATGSGNKGHRPAQQRARAAPVTASPIGGAGRPWREAVMERVRAWDGGAGARILVDQAQGVPLTLLLENLSPLHCEKAVGELGLLLQTVPLPPRLRIQFAGCPEGPAPRHHLVGKALGTVLDPGSFKALATADQVDVMFHAPDARWRTDW